MEVAYLYLATDGVDDFKKFGIAKNIKSRLIDYNSTQHIRPIYFERVFELTSYKEVRQYESNLKRKLKYFITQTHRIETFVWDKNSEKIFNEEVRGLKEINPKNEYIGNKQNKDFNYYNDLIDLIHGALKSGIPDTTIEELVIKTKVGYYRENATKTVVKEKRIKPLIKITDKHLYWDTKPTIYERLKRLYNFEDEIKKIID